MLPLSLTMAAAWAIGHLAPHHALPMPGWLTPTIVAVVGFANVHARKVTRRRREAHWVRYSLAFSTTLSYTSILIAIQPAAKRLDWLPALAWAVAGMLLAFSFRMTLTELRVGEASRNLDAVC